MSVADKRVVELRVNGSLREVAVQPGDLLLDLLREDLNLTGTRRGCDQGTCGCCTVHIDGEPRLACMTLALDCVGKAIRTIEDLAQGEELHPLQEAMVRMGATQCGFCTPGFIMTGIEFLQRNPAPSREEIREAIGGNMCRCTGYSKIVDAVEEAAAVLRGEHTPPPQEDQRGPSPHELLP